MDPIQAQAFVQSAQSPVMEELARKRAAAEQALFGNMPTQIALNNYGQYMDPTYALKLASNDRDRMLGDVTYYQNAIDNQSNNAASMLNLLIQARQQQLAEQQAQAEIAYKNAQIAALGKQDTADNKLLQEYQTLAGLYGEDVAKKMIQSAYSNYTPEQAAAEAQGGGGISPLGAAAGLGIAALVGKKIISTAPAKAAMAKIATSPVGAAATKAGGAITSGLGAMGVAAPTTAAGWGLAGAAAIPAAYYVTKAIQGANALNDGGYQPSYNEYVDAGLWDPKTWGQSAKQVLWDMPKNDIMSLWNRYTK